MRRPAAEPAPSDPDSMGRRRLLGTLVGVAAGLLLLLAGLGYALYLAVVPSEDRPSATVAPAPGDIVGTQSRRDRIAAAPMLDVAAADAQPAVPAAIVGPVILVPPATTVGPGDVPSGFPRTPEGAVGQLAAIETTVFQAMSIAATQEIHRQWTAGPQAEGGLTPPSGAPGGTGGTGAAGWEIMRHVQSFLGTAQMGPEKDLTATVSATPAAGQVKGVDGPAWVLACVLLEVRAVIATEARIGFGHCERMQWQDGRWLIAPGAAPARAPSTWPGSQRSLDAGWRTWVDTGEESAGEESTGEATSGAGAADGA